MYLQHFGMLFVNKNKNSLMKKIILIFLYSFLSYSTVFAQGNWKLEKDKDGIKVWTRKQANSNLKEYKGVMVIPADMDNLITFFKNYKLFEKWMYKTDAGSAKLVKKTNDLDFVIRLTMSAPLVKSRESVTHFLINAPDAKGMVMINLNTVPDLLPPNNDYVRIPKMSGYWKLTPVDDAKIEITHQAPVVAGGSLPDVMANLGAVDAPYSMLANLRKLFK